MSSDVSLSRTTGNEQSPWKPFAERSRDREVKREAVLRTAAHLFVEQGYHNATLADVAKQLHITKPALFHYFASKEDILLECYRFGQEIVDRHLHGIASHSGRGREKVKAFIRAYTEFMTTDFGKIIARVGDQDLSPEPREEIRRKKRLVDRQLRDLIEEGVADGSISPCDLKLTTFAIAGSLNWIGSWYQANGPLTPEAIGDYFATLLIGGITPPGYTEARDTPADPLPLEGAEEVGASQQEDISAN